MNIVRNTYKRITSVTTLRDDLLCLMFYTFIWGLLTAFLIHIFRNENRLLMWAVDGLYQHYPAFTHLCSNIESLLNGEPISWYSLELGQGADILTTLNCYDLTDPLSIFTAAMVPLSRVTRYELMIVLKLYLIGISFYVFCRVTGRDNGIHIISGALAYTFSGNILNMLTRHPNFINWAYFFPLMLAGAERYRRRRKPGLFIATVFFNILINYYTFYINVVLLIVYLLICSVCSYMTSKEKGHFTGTLKLLFKLAAFGLTGVLLSMFLTLPTLYAYLSNTRVARKTGYMASLFHYEPGYYLTYFSNICSFNEVKYLSVTGMNAAAFTAILLLLIILYKKRRDPSAAIKRVMYPAALVIMLLFLCMPVAGQVFNGFSYATNRWSYALFFFSGLALTELLSLSSDIDRQSCLLSVAVVTVYILIVALFLNKDNDPLTLAGLITLGLISIVMIITIMSADKYRDMIILSVTVTACIFQICFLYGTSWRGFVSEHISPEDIEYRMADNSFEAAGADDTVFFRTAKTPAVPSQNQEVLYGQHGISLYWSVIPSWVFDYHLGFELPDMISLCNIGGLDSRTALMELAGVKYFFKPDEVKAPVPFGYKKAADTSDGQSNGLYVNEYALPIGYFYDSYISPKAYDGMDPMDKQQALLEGILIDDIPDNVSELDYRSGIIDLEYNIINAEGIELTDELIRNTGGDGSITLSADIPSGCEIFLRIDGIELYGDRGICSVNVSRVLNDEMIVQSQAPIHNRNFTWPVMRDGITYNLGYGGEGINEFRISLPDMVTIGYNSIKLMAVPMSGYPEKIAGLKASELKDIKITPDRISGRINVDTDGFLQFSIPYSIGWSAYDNGSKTELVRSDIMYMAVPLEAGEHTIELKYHVPYFFPGMCISLVTAVILMLIYVRKYRMKDL